MSPISVRYWTISIVDIIIIGPIWRHIVNTLSIYAWRSCHQPSEVARGLVNSHCPLVLTVCNKLPIPPPINSNMAMESTLPVRVRHDQLRFGFLLELLEGLIITKADRPSRPAR